MQWKVISQDNESNANPGERRTEGQSMERTKGTGYAIRVVGRIGRKKKEGTRRSSLIMGGAGEGRLTCRPVAGGVSGV